jgi:hypothetical protein
MKTPQIRILFSYLLYYGESQLLAKSHNREVEISYEECVDLTEKYKKSWSEKEAMILEGMQNIFGLTFYKPIIDAHLAPVFIPKSEPLILNFRRDPDEFIDLLSHELLHNLFTDNQYVQHHIYTDLLKVWKKLFGDRDNVELVHIPVHAGLKAIYLDVLKEPYRLERDIKECQQWPSYKAAWEYVDKNDYKKIIRDFKKSYKTL